MKENLKEMTNQLLKTCEKSLNPRDPEGLTWWSHQTVAKEKPCLCAEAPPFRLEDERVESMEKRQVATNC